MKSMDSLSTEKVSNHIHEDIAFSILSKLPIKSLRRFSSVSKSWSCLIENPIFMNMYRNSFISDAYEDDGSCLLLQQALPYPLDYRHVLYFLSGERFENKVKLGLPSPFKESNTSGYILGPVINGIVCLSRGPTRVVLWNPTIDEFKVLPKSPTKLEPLVCYEQSVDSLHGFGYDSVRDDYKVIRHVHYVLDLSEYEIESDGHFERDALSLPTSVSREDVWEIYSLRSNSWRKLDLDMPCGMYAYVGVNVYLNGVCHWWGDDEDDDSGAYLVSFDLSKEVFCKTLMPSTLIDNFDSGFAMRCFRREMRHLTVLQDNISLISYYGQPATFYISILGAVGVRESWTKLFTLGPLPGINHPIGEGKNGDLFFRRDDNELVWFNLKTQMMEELGIKGQMQCCQVVIYKESRVSLGGLNG